LSILDADGYAVCPDCSTRINCGTIGLANLEKRHRGTKACNEARAKRDKDGCLCGLVLDGRSGGVVRCNQSGCETQWVSTMLSSRIVLHYLPEMLVSPPMR
ncbi:hypothetical protein BYT27DRAFT_7105589, partial [Phlegmacium glaucopus]